MTEKRGRRRKGTVHPYICPREKTGGYGGTSGGGRHRRWTASALARLPSDSRTRAPSVAVCDGRGPDETTVNGNDTVLLYRDIWRARTTVGWSDSLTVEGAEDGADSVSSKGE